MKSVKQKLIDSIERRLRTEIVGRNPLKYLKKFSSVEIVEISIAPVFLYSRVKGIKKRQPAMAETVTAIGHAIRDHYKLKKDSSLAAKGGAFVLYSFEEAGIIRARKSDGENGHAQYIVEVLNEDVLSALWGSIPAKRTEKLPALTPPADWVSFKHESGLKLVKTRNTDVIGRLSPEAQPLVFSSINRAQKVGWQINQYIYDLHLWAFRNKTDAFSGIWEMQNAEAKQSKIREAKIISDMASRYLGKIFYHMYSYDFRGRRYAATAYLNEQGTDLAKGLLCRADKKPIGEQGFVWLLISIANNWAGDAGRSDGLKTDKIPLRERVLWGLDNEEILLSYAEHPKVNQGWMQADSPWQFLAGCHELYNLRIWQGLRESTDGADHSEDYGYESHMEAYIDGSNNGSQHLAALSKDEVTARHVNLVPLPLPGDLYMYVAEHAWNAIAEHMQKISPEQLVIYEKFIDTIVDIKKQINEAMPRSARRLDMLKDLQKLKTSQPVLMDNTCVVFWNRVVDAKERRKVIKRNVMTIPYGGTAYGLGQQQIDDARKHGIDLLLYMEHRWGSWLGRLVYDDCRKSLQKPMQLLTLFEAAGQRAADNGVFLSWDVPVTNFPVVQHYVEGRVKKLYIQYGPPEGEIQSTGYYKNTFQLRICHIEDTTPSLRKQASGAAPNIVHSLDAAHLMITIDKCKFPVSTIHDSYGALLADVPELFVAVREAFVELYANDPLQNIFNQIGVPPDSLQLGSLDVSQILESDYAFC